MADRIPVLRPIGEGVIRRTRRRVHSFGLSEKDRQKLAEHVCDNYRRDLQARSAETDIRLQRYAKYRLWRGPDLGWPWPGSSNQIVPDMLEASTRMQDVLHNAVMSARPICVSRALQPDKKEQERAVDALHDTQLFIEQPGESVVEQAAEAFCNDPAMTFYTAWITERREVMDVRVFDPIPDGEIPAARFGDILAQAFPDWLHLSSEEGWDWTIEEEKASASDGIPETRDISFYTKPGIGGEAGDVEMVVKSMPVVFDGPKVRVIPYDDVICPPGAANLDIPGPSNPGGATHVILRDSPTKDEIKRLSRNRGEVPSFYDLFGSKDDFAKLDGAAYSPDYHEVDDQKSTFSGEELEHEHTKLDKTAQPVTRLVSFDCYDIDGDGVAEDVVCWVLYETKQLLRVRALTEFFPGSKPERPFASASYLPVGGRRAGISLLETMEGLHDWAKETVDQMVDNGTLTNLPWGTYRAGSSLKPETIRPGPGDLIPLNDPRNDIVMQQFRSDGQAFWLNLLTIIRQQTERVTLQGDLQAGRVPTGASSALRTLGGIQTLLSQGEARPERILRRFFMALTRMHRQMHRWNRHNLSDQKKFRAAPTILSPGEDPYFVVATSDVDLDLEFDFHANVMNSSKQALQQGLQSLLGIYVSELAIQLGISTPETIYRLLRDVGRAFGQNVDGYLQEPSPGAGRRKVEAAEAVLMISRGAFPDGDPLEGAAAQLEAIQEITTWDSFGEFPPEYLGMLRQYMERLAQQAAAEQQAASIAASAGGVGEPLGAGGGRPGRPPERPVQPQQQAALQSGELMDETLPSAGGGGNAG